MMGDTVYIPHPEYCDLCKSQGLQVQAVYDGKTVHGPWAYMCEEHYGAMGVGLGTGRGQILIIGKKPDPEDSSNRGITEVDDEDDTDETIASNSNNETSPHLADTTDNTEPSTNDTPVQDTFKDSNEGSESPETALETVKPVITDEEAEKPAQKRRRLRAERRKKTFEERLTEADYSRADAHKNAAPKLPETEKPVEEQVPYVMKMDWGDLSR